MEILERESEWLDDRPARAGGASARIVCESSAMKPVITAARRAAAWPSTVLLLGETGTGKEMLARFIHQSSPRADQPFVTVDCSALPETLIESQLFGHARGAFTGALRESLGFVRAADRGTLFFDEIGELSLSLQAKLLRVIQERCVVPVGETRPCPVDIRIICATHRDLKSMVAEGAFRQDLYFRLSVLCMNLPPLRERQADVLPLASMILERFAPSGGEAKQLSHEAAELLLRYSWPGNIRELFNVMEHAAVLTDGDFIEPADLPPHLSDAAIPAAAVSDINLESVERRTIVEALRRTRNNRAEASRMLGIEPRRLNRRIRALNIPFGKSALRHSRI